MSVAAKSLKYCGACMRPGRLLLTQHPLLYFSSALNQTCVELVQYCHHPTLFVRNAHENFRESLEILT